MGYIDCDSHLNEDDATWEYFDPGEEIYRPRLAAFSEPVNGIVPPPVWLVGDTWANFQPGHSNRLGNANIYEPDATQLLDPSVRLRDMDALGIDVQLLISSFFIGVELDHPLIEAAVARSYNRWAADLAGEHQERLPWTVRAPLRMFDRAFEDMEFGKAHGAAGIHVRGVEHGYFLSDPYFFPLYERAQDLDMAIIVHVGLAHRRMHNLPVGKLLPMPPAFMAHVHSTMAGFHAVVSSDMHTRFPRLRWGFVEAGATWIPAVLQQHARLISSGGEFLKLAPVTPEVLEEKNIFVACEADEDLGYLTSVLGENVLCAGTDYGHNDVGTELAAHATILARTDITPSQARKIVDTNGRRLLGLPVPAAGSAEDPKGIPDTLPHVRGAATSDGRPLLTSMR